MAWSRQPDSESKNFMYTFSSVPHPVPARRKWKEPATKQNECQGVCTNIMHDRRVVRGNTYAQHVPRLSQPDPVEILRQQEARKRATARRAKHQVSSRTPDPVKGRKHAELQTELYLEELGDPVEESNVACQTDEFLDVPDSPLFVPASTGRDIATQIEEGELFDFDIEVQPLLDVLVGKTIEQALLEVSEEDELASLRAQQRAFQELRNAERVEVQRLEDQETRRREEKARRIKQQRDILEKERETAEKIAATTFARHYLSDLVPSVFRTLRDQGYFYDPVHRDIERDYLPWLTAQVISTLEKRQAARDVLDSIIQDVINRRFDEFKIDEPK